MEFVKYDPAKAKTPRSIFTLIGTVIKNKEESILIQKVNSKRQFWLDKNGYVCNMDEGTTGTFTVTISTYKGKDGDILWTKPRFNSGFPLEGEVQKDHPGFIGVRTGKITDSIQTDVPGFHIVIFTTTEGETFHLRYISNDPIKPGSCTITMDLNTSPILVDMEGNTWESPRKFKSKDKGENGEDIFKTIKRWFPILDLKSIKYT